MRLLILLPLAPRLDAANGGSRVITQFLTEIIARHKVAVLYFREANEPGADAYFRTRCELLAEVVRPASEKSLWRRLQRYFRLLLSLFLLRPLWVTDWSSHLFAKEAKRLAMEFQPDVIQAEFHVMGQYFSVLTGIKARRVLVEYEPGARAALYLQYLPGILRRWIGWIERISWQRYQTELYSQVDAIVAFTEADHSSISKTAGGTPVHIISPGIVIPPQPLNPLGSPPLSLLFFGNFYHPPNADAGRRLVESIFPGVEKLFPDARLFIVGENPPASLGRIQSKNIVITGRVPDVTPYLDQAALLVAPLHFGGGIRIKVLESLAAGKAIVTTSRAAEGLDIQDGEQLAIAETDDEFIDRIVQLLQNPEERLALSGRARAWASEHLGWETSIDKYETLYEGLLL
jgi:glycosyltransferase involved in cell wall biosynthesis